MSSSNWAGHRPSVFRFGSPLYRAAPLCASQPRGATVARCGLFDDQPPKRKKQPYGARQGVKQRRQQTQANEDDGQSTPGRLPLSRMLAATRLHGDHRQCLQLVKKRAVTVNGRPALAPTVLIDPLVDQVREGGGGRRRK